MSNLNEVVVNEAENVEVMEGAEDMQNTEEVVTENTEVVEEVVDEVEGEEVEETDDDSVILDLDTLDFDLISLDKSMQPVACGTIAKNMKDGKFTFENTVQRTNVWKPEQKSLLIHSLITKMPIPAMYARGCEGGVKDFLDGKQRATAIKEFFFNELTLVNCPPIQLVIDIDDAKEKGIDVDAYEVYKDDRIILPININGYTYETLPSTLQDEFRTATINIYTYKNHDDSELDDEQTAEMFYRLNNGTPLTKIEITRVRAKDYAKIKDMASHDLFTEALTKASLNKYANEDIVMKSLVLLTEDYPSLDNKDVRPFIEEIEIDDGMVTDIKDIYDMIRDAHTCMVADADNSNDGDARKHQLKVAKKVYVRTHLMTIVPITQKAISEDKSCRELANFFNYFFDGKNGTSVSKKYNDNARDGANHANKVNIRLNELEKAYDKFFAEADKAETDETVA